MNAPARQEVITQEQTAVAPITPMGMLQLAVQQNADMDKLEKLMALQERWEKNEAAKAFNAAFSSFRSEAVQIIRNKTVEQGPLSGKKYAELFSVINAVTPALSKNGLSASWKITKDEKDWIEVTCTVKHVLGHSDSVSMGGPPDVGGAKSAIQARASTVSFLERYTLKAICGVAEAGDDKNGSGNAAPEPDEEGKKALEACGSLSKLQETWKALTAEQRKTLGAVKDACKKRIEEADRAAQQ